MGLINDGAAYVRLPAISRDDETDYDADEEKQHDRCDTTANHDRH